MLPAAANTPKTAPQTRHQRRAAARSVAKAQRAIKRETALMARAQALKARKATRAKEAAAARTPEQKERRRRGDQAREANIRTRVIGPYHERNRSILAERVVKGIEVSYHATKGWRRVREASGAALMALPVQVPHVVIERDHEGHKARAVGKRETKNRIRLARKLLTPAIRADWKATGSDPLTEGNVRGRPFWNQP